MLKQEANILYKDPGILGFVGHIVSIAATQLVVVESQHH